MQKIEKSSKKNSIVLKISLRGGGHPKFFGKLILEILVVQKPPPSDRTFGWVSGPPCPSGHAGRPCPNLGTEIRILKNKPKPSLWVLYL